MKFAVFICIACLVLIGIVSASGETLNVKGMRNTSIAKITVPTTQPTQDEGVIENIVAPIANIFPTATATPIQQAGQQETNTTILPRPSIIPQNLGSLSSGQNAGGQQTQKFTAPSATDPCNEANGAVTISGTMYWVYVQESPAKAWGGVVYDYGDQTLYDIRSSDSDVYSLMQTAMITQKNVRVTAYPVPTDPNDGWTIFSPHKVCSMVLSSDT